MKATGIDLAVESRPTGFCIVYDSLRSSTCLLYTDNEILDKTLKCAPDVVAIDAPLALPGSNVFIFGSLFFLVILAGMTINSLQLSV